MAGKKSDSVPLSQVDAMVRSRIAEIMSAAGVDYGRVGVEVLYKLPAGLVQVYEVLWDLSMYGEERNRRDDAEVGVANDPDNRGGGGGGRTRDTDRSRERMGELVVRSGGSARRGARGSSRGSDVSVARGVDSGGELGDRVNEIRARADKRLRAVARDVAAELSALGLGVDLASGEMMVRMERRGMTAGRVEGGRGANAAMGEAIMRSIDRDDN